MALSVSQTVALHGLLKPKMKVASMGYPDIIMPFATIEHLFGSCNDIAFRDDSEEICKRHGLEPCRIPDAHSLFRLMGCELHVYDIMQERGCERPCDLNESRNLAYAAAFYDVVLDVGTLEHCFNIGEAMRNMAGLVKAGGCIIHENPFNWGNHGFVNLNPTFYADFYVTNGFEIVTLELADKAGAKAGVPFGRRFVFTGREVNVFCIARRVTMQGFVWPVQSKYAALIPAAVDSGERAASERAKEIANG